MATPKKKKTEVAIVAPTPPNELVLEGNPEKQLQFAQKAAQALMKVVESKPKKIIINNKQYLEFGAWQTLGRFFGATVGVEWTRRIERDGKYLGYEARAIVYQHGVIVSSAEASCLTEERNWRGRDEFAVKSMAQTRAAAKALRNGFGWVAELAGYQSTPAEEMTADMYDNTPVPESAKVHIAGTDTDEEETDMPPIPEDTKQQKIIIASLLKQRGVDIQDLKAIRRYVEDETQLSLVPQNYKEIIRILS